MSQSATTCFVVTFRYQEEGLADLAKLTGQLTLQGFVTSVADENGVPHELGSNSFCVNNPTGSRGCTAIGPEAWSGGLGQGAGGRHRHL
jgi:hypothetical protein